MSGTHRRVRRITHTAGLVAAGATCLAALAPALAARPAATCPAQPATPTYLQVRNALGVPVAISGGGRSCDAFSGAWNPQRYVAARRAFAPSPPAPATLRIDQRLLDAPSWANAWHWTLRVRGARQFTTLDLRAVNDAGWVLQARAAGGNWVSARAIGGGAYAAPRGAVVVGAVGGRRVQARPLPGSAGTASMTLSISYSR